MSFKEGSISHAPSKLTAVKKKGKGKPTNPPKIPAPAEFAVEDAGRLLFSESFCKRLEAAMYDDFAVSVAWSKNCVDLMSAIRVMGRVPDPRTAELLYEFATKHAAMSPEPTLSTKDANVPEKPDSTSFLTPSENSPEKEMLFFTSPIPDLERYPVLGPLTEMFQKHLCLSAHRTHHFIKGYHAQPGELRALQDEFAASNVGYQTGFLSKAMHNAVAEYDEKRGSIKQGRK